MNVYQAAVRDIRDARRTDLDNGRILWQDALAADDKLYAAFVAYQEQMIKNAKGEPNEIDAARSALGKETARLGLTREKLSPPFRCKICGDTGYADGKYCACVIRRVISSDKENLSLPTVEFAKAQKSAPTAALKKLYGAAEKYARAFPDGTKPFLVIIGEAGTGKTTLAAAVATELMHGGAAAVTVSAFEFTRRALEYHTQFSIDDYTDRFTPMLDCDLLVIDDLGTESMLKNVTKEYLYTVVNERWLHKKYTVITTNLSPDKLIARYGESITSRLFDKNVASAFAVNTKNLRA